MPVAGSERIATMQVKIPNVRAFEKKRYIHHGMETPGGNFFCAGEDHQ